MAHSMALDIQEVVVRVPNSGTYHRASLNLITDRVLPPRGCYVGDTDRLEVYQDMPDEAQGIDLCLHCYPIGSDR